MCTNRRSDRAARSIWTWLWPLTGLAALAWFLIRVIPKPSRATYPCQQVAGKLAGGFLVWVAGLLGARLAFHKAHAHLARKAFIAAAIMFVLGIWIIWLTLPAPGVSAAFVPVDPPNMPIGVAKGIHPGRVVWVHDPAATRWNGITGNWWEDPNTDQGIVDAMLSRAVRTLTGQQDDRAAWDALFRHYNQGIGQGDVGYQVPEAIAIKINTNQDNGGPWPKGAGMPSPQVIQSLLQQLIHVAGVPGELITVYDASRAIGDPIYQRISNSPDPQLQKVRFVTRPSNATQGRLPAEPDYRYPVIFADKTIQYGARAFLPTCVTQAKYLINVALLRPHTLFGITVCGKNLFGTIYWSGYTWTPEPLHNYGLRGNRMGSYNCLVDLIGHPHLGGKTILYLIDGLYPALNQTSNVIRYDSLGNAWASLILASQDPIAIDSVALDIMRNEPRCVEVTGQGVDNYLHEGALADNPPSRVFYDPDGDKNRLTSLGVHEHWNNPVDKQYSRNLGLGSGIELVRPQAIDANGPVMNTRTGIRYDSISAAIGAAVDGDVIVVSPGLYSESVTIYASQIVLRSSDPNNLEVIRSTVIQAQPIGLSLYNCLGTTRIEGLTITGCGIGIRAVRSRPQLYNCRIVANATTAIVAGNSSSIRLVNCLVAGNGGNGIDLVPVKTARGHVYHSSGEIIQCTIADNKGYGLSGGIVTVNGSIIYGNQAGQILCDSAQVSYSNVQAGWSGVGNIAVEPGFVDADYHISADSGCVDAGDPGFAYQDVLADIDGQPRILNGRIDIGIDEVPLTAE